MTRLIASGLLAFALLLPASPAAEPGADDAGLAVRADRSARGVETRVLSWRRDFHQYPELSNREFRTAGIVADHLEALGLEVRRNVAHTGVVGVLRGGRPGATVGLRADMDALPVTEEVDLPFASKVRSIYLGREVGVMHACGHDAHTAILMGTAQVLAELREDLPGNVLFLFQPAEEGAPPGEEGGARRMIAEGALEDPRPDVMFALHVVPQYRTGEIGLVPGGAMASSDRLRIVVKGRQTHAAYPWLGVDPITVASRIVLALQAIPGRQLDARHPSVVSIGAIHGGVRHNIIPEEVELLGTIRTLEPSLQAPLHQRIERTAQKIAESSGASAEVEIQLGYPVTYNDPELTNRMAATFQRLVGPEGVVTGLPRTGAEDFSFFQREVPGLYFWLGVRPPDVPLDEAAPNHSPQFVVDEAALPLGVRVLTHLAIAYLGDVDPEGPPSPALPDSRTDAP
jgi:amidohydrolase